MKHVLFKKTFLLLAILLFSVCAVKAQIATVCDTCTSAWGPSILKKYTNQTVQGMSPLCLYDIYVEIQTRICNGKIQVKCGGIYYNQLSSDPSCDITCGFVLLNLMDKATKLVLVDLGGNIVVNRPSSCYYSLEYRLTPALKACMGNEATLHPKWYTLLPCGTSCCVTEYQLLANGDVLTVSSSTGPCVGAPPSPIPATTTVYCWSNGVRTAYLVPVVAPAAPLSCINICHTDGDIFTARQAHTAIENGSNGAMFFPNPAQTEITIAPGISWKQITVTDISGRTIIQRSYNGNATMDISRLSAGTYIAYLELENGDKEHFKFIKKQ